MILYRTQIFEATPTAVKARIAEVPMAFPETWMELNFLEARRRRQRLQQRLRRPKAPTRARQGTIRVAQNWSASPCLTSSEASKGKLEVSENSWAAQQRKLKQSEVGGGEGAAGGREGLGRCEWMTGSCVAGM